MLLEVSDPVLLHRQRAVELYLAETEPERRTGSTNTTSNFSYKTLFAAVILEMVHSSEYSALATKKWSMAQQEMGGGDRCWGIKGLFKIEPESSVKAAA